MESAPIRQKVTLLLLTIEVAADGPFVLGEDDQSPRRAAAGLGTSQGAPGRPRAGLGSRGVSQAQARQPAFFQRGNGRLLGLRNP